MRRESDEQKKLSSASGMMKRVNRMADGGDNGEPGIKAGAVHPRLSAEHKPRAAVRPSMAAFGKVRARCFSPKTL